MGVLKPGRIGMEMWEWECSNLVEQGWKFFRVPSLAYPLPSTSSRCLDHDRVPDPFCNLHSMSGVRDTALAVELVWNVDNPSLGVCSLIQFEAWGYGSMGE